MGKHTHETLKEARVHGNTLFPLGVYHIEIGPGEPVLDCHWHDEAEFFYVVEGKTQFQVDTSYFEVKAGEAVFIHGGEIHAGYAADENSNCLYSATVFNMEMLNSSMYDAIQHSYMVPILENTKILPRHIRGGTEWEQNVLRSLKSIIHAYDHTSPGYELAIKAHLFLILSEIAAGNHWVVRGNPTPLETGKVDRLKEVLSYIQMNYAKKIKVEELAGMIHLSEGQFIRFFKEMTRKTPIEYMNAYRINQAAGLLRQGNPKIYHVALDVGFDNLSYFIKVFREHMNCTPSEYRKSFA